MKPSIKNNVPHIVSNRRLFYGVKSNDPVSNEPRSQINAYKRGNQEIKARQAAKIELLKAQMRLRRLQRELES